MRVFALSVLLFLVLSFVAKVLLPKAFEGETHTEREARLSEVFLEVGLALERFRVEEGKYPDVLSELNPKYLESLPSDPWSRSEEALGYVVRGRAEHSSAASVLLYSVGPDGVDDGGIQSIGGSSNGDRVYPVW
jgi:hypothetical protein